ncbi:MAG: alkaline phosphatase D family protein [Phenylobacterium sp.]|uniref:alkaline phosphatase D family protein n=1 Tax=Phenylobacterium sp. TaxID=1871053 RepID=UPI0027158148|nr:alkaline phosphatase D family protein [Phenylobacterium sp.]MDO8900695.1 alkaline phosphatase D family protein [Phenylobacterium sp.]
MNIDRRRALALLGIGAAAPLTAHAQSAYSGAVAFEHGVASGDPLADAVVLWTRITPKTDGAGLIAYAWRLNPVDRRAGGAKSGAGLTGPDRDFTVKVDVTGLDPARAYTFEFEANGVTSPMGRTRTLPTGEVRELVFAVASCSLYPYGYFNAYQAIADLPKLDAVVHLGDYIYEYGGPGSYGMNSAVAAERPHIPDREIVSLEDYRQRHAQYKTDPQLQAAHARAPWIVSWDDHETANNSWMGGAQNHTPETEGDWNVRKANALKAYFEWMPIRDPAPGGSFEAMNRSFQFGDLASLMMLETRLTARDDQLDYGRDLPVVDGQPDLAAFRQKLADPARRMMSPAQEDWLAKELAQSVQSGRTWQILGNQVVMARMDVPSPSKVLGEEAVAAAIAAQPEDIARRIEQMERLAAMGLPYGMDMWDGYPAARERLYDAVEAAGARAIVVSGDSHAFWVNELHDDDGVLRAVEFGTTGITSPGAGDTVKDLPVGELYIKGAKEVVHSDHDAKGFVLLTLTPDMARGDLMTVSSITSRDYETRVRKAYAVSPLEGGVSPLKPVEI